MSKGIEQTKEAVQAIVQIAESVNKSLDDGKFSFADTTNFFDDVPAMIAAVQGCGEIASELHDLDDAEVREIEEAVCETVGDMSGAKGEAIASCAIRVAFEINELLKELRG